MRRPSIRVLIVDDHPIVREGLSAILSTGAGIEVSGQASRSREALARFRKLRPDVTLLDVHLLNESGLDLLRRIREIDAEATVVMISAYGHGEDIHRALELGARGFVLKDLGAEELVGAIREVHAGGRAMPARVSRRLAERASVGELNPREREVLALLARGLCNRDIARELAISEGTAKAHLNHIFEKLGVADRTQAVLVALRIGLAHPEGEGVRTSPATG